MPSGWAFEDHNPTCGGEALRGAIYALLIAEEASAVGGAALPGNKGGDQLPDIVPSPSLPVLELTPPTRVSLPQVPEGTETRERPLQLRAGSRPAAATQRTLLLNRVRPSVTCEQSDARHRQARATTRSRLLAT